MTIQSDTHRGKKWKRMLGEHLQNVRRKVPCWRVVGSLSTTQVEIREGTEI